MGWGGVEIMFRNRGHLCSRRYFIGGRRFGSWWELSDGCHGSGWFRGRGATLGNRFGFGVGVVVASASHDEDRCLKRVAVNYGK